MERRNAMKVGKGEKYEEKKESYDKAKIIKGTEEESQ